MSALHIKEREITGRKRDRLGNESGSKTFPLSRGKYKEEKQLNLFAGRAFKKKPDLL